MKDTSLLCYKFALKITSSTPEAADVGEILIKNLA